MSRYTKVIGAAVGTLALTATLAACSSGEPDDDSTTTSPTTTDAAADEGIFVREVTATTTPESGAEAIASFIRFMAAEDYEAACEIVATSAEDPTQTKITPENCEASLRDRNADGVDRGEDLTTQDLITLYGEPLLGEKDNGRLGYTYGPDRVPGTAVSEDGYDWQDFKRVSVFEVDGEWLVDPTRGRDTDIPR